MSRTRLPGRKNAKCDYFSVHPPVSSIRAGQRRKELVSHATALLTDNRGVEMKLRLWSDLASDENMTKLREVVIQPVPAVISEYKASDEGTQNAREGGATPLRRNGDRPIVFEFTRLRPEMSFSCEALLLNTTQDSEIKKLRPDSKEALTVANAVVGAVATTLGSAHLTKDPNSDATGYPPQMGSGSCEAAVEQSPGSARVFGSVDQLMNAEGFSGMARLTGVVVRKLLVDAPRDSATFAPTAPSALDASFLTGDGSVTLFLGDPVDTSKSGCLGGVESIVRVHVNHDALRDILGAIPWELSVLCGKASGGASSSSDLVDAAAWEAVAPVARSLLDGLVQGGQEGERLSVVLVCVASSDENGRVVQGGTLYRMVQLHANLAL